MPKLLAFLPAEKVLIDAQDNSLAIVGVLGGLSVGVPQGETLPEGSGSPMHWHLIALWRRIPSDEGQSYQQRVQLISPSERVFFEAVMDFRLNTVTHRNRLTVQGLPTSEQGEHILRLSLRRLPAAE